MKHPPDLAFTTLMTRHKSLVLWSASLLQPKTCRNPWINITCKLCQRRNTQFTYPWKPISFVNILASSVDLSWLHVLWGKSNLSSQREKVASSICIANCTHSNDWHTFSDVREKTFFIMTVQFSALWSIKLEDFLSFLYHL